MFQLTHEKHKFIIKYENFQKLDGLTYFSSRFFQKLAGCVVFQPSESKINEYNINIYIFHQDFVKNRKMYSENRVYIKF